MKKLEKLFGIIAIITAVCLFTTCTDEDYTEWEPDRNFTVLSVNTWADGSLTLQKKEQWYKFTAISDNQYFHLKYGTIDGSLYIEPYDKKGKSLASSKSLYNNQCAAFTVIKGKPHFIKITPGSSSTTGTFKIAFTNLELSPDSLVLISAAPTLTDNAWYDGSFTSERREEWFRFIATSTNSQYIHMSFGTASERIYIQVYSQFDNPFFDLILPLDPQKPLKDGEKTQPTVTAGFPYYIKVTPYSSSSTGTYKIAFNTLQTAPSLE